MNYLEFPESVLEIKKLLKKYKRNYSLKIGFSNENKFIVGMFSNECKNDLFSQIQFINAINNTKDNFLLSVDNYLKYIKNDNLLPKNDENTSSKIIDPYFDDPQYFWLENMVIRIGSLWDEFSHLCNIFYNIGIDAARVQASIIFNKNNADKNIYPIINEVYKYFEQPSNFINNNCHKFVKELRNRLIHYCDFKAVKFFSNYLENKYCLSLFPNGIYFGYILFDYFSFIELFDQFMKCFNKKLLLNKNQQVFNG